MVSSTESMSRQNVEERQARVQVRRTLPYDKVSVWISYSHSRRGLESGESFDGQKTKSKLPKSFTINNWKLERCPTVRTSKEHQLTAWEQSGERVAAILTKTVNINLTSRVG